MNVEGVVAGLVLAVFGFAQGVPLALKPAAALRWLRGLSPLARFFLRVDPNRYGVEEAHYWGIVYIVCGCLCLGFAAAAAFGIIK